MHIHIYSSTIKALYLFNPKLYFHIHISLGVYPILSYKYSVHIIILYAVNIPYQYLLLCKNIIHILPIISLSEFLFSCTHTCATRTTPSPDNYWVILILHQVARCKRHGRRTLYILIYSFVLIINLAMDSNETNWGSSHSTVECCLLLHSDISVLWTWSTSLDSWWNTSCIC